MPAGAEPNVSNSCRLRYNCSSGEIAMGAGHQSLSSTANTVAFCADGLMVLGTDRSTHVVQQRSILEDPSQHGGLTKRYKLGEDFDMVPTTGTGSKYGRIAAVAELPQQGTMLIERDARHNPLVWQPLPARRFAILSSLGTYVYTAARPVEVLRSHLDQGDSSKLHQFFNPHPEHDPHHDVQRGEAVAAVMHLAVGPYHGRDEAFKAFLRYSCKPKFKEVQHYPGALPQNQAAAKIVDEVLSYKYLGMCRFVYRVLGTVWSERMIADVKPGSKVFKPRFREAEISALLEFHLLPFKERCQQLLDQHPGKGSVAVTPQFQKEFQQLDGLYRLCEAVTEALGLWRVLLSTNGLFRDTMAALHKSTARLSNGESPINHLRHTKFSEMCASKDGKLCLQEVVKTALDKTKYLEYVHRSSSNSATLNEAIHRLKTDDRKATIMLAEVNGSFHLLHKKGHSAPVDVSLGFSISSAALNGFVAKGGGNAGYKSPTAVSQTTAVEFMAEVWKKAVPRGSFDEGVWRVKRDSALVESLNTVLNMICPGLHNESSRCLTEAYDALLAAKLVKDQTVVEPAHRARDKFIKCFEQSANHAAIRKGPNGRLAELDFIAGLATDSVSGIGQACHDFSELFVRDNDNGNGTKLIWCAHPRALMLACTYCSPAPVHDCGSSCTSYSWVEG